MRTMCCMMLLVSVVACPRAVSAEDVVEKYANGQTRVRYTTDGQGRKVGEYVEYFESGKIRVRATYVRGELGGDYVERFEAGGVRIKADYKAGKLSGAYVLYHENGKPAVRAVYADGKRHGAWVETDADGRVTAEQIFWNDTLLYGRSRRMIKETLESILGPTAKMELFDPTRSVSSGWRTTDRTKSADGSADLGELHRLNAYRYLVGVPYDVTLSKPYGELAQAAADICARLGQLTHTPPNPGMPNDEYAKAREGASSSNLSQGHGTRGSVDGYMCDSDTTNIDRVGHRRWCINPAMQQCAFGESGEFSAMYAHDRSRKDVPDYDHVAYPPAGFVPRNFCGSRHAWSVSVNPAKYRVPDKAAIKVTVRPLAKADKGKMPNPAARGAPLELDFFNVDLGGYGIPNAVIFRAKGVSTTDGSAYWVEIKGLQRLDGADAALEYIVHFVDL